MVPFKRAEASKTRLVPPLGISRPDLARAMARDALAVAAHVLGPASVLVVTADEPMRRYAEEVGIETLTDPGTGLNSAILAGVAQAARHAHRVAVLMPDVPALKAAELRQALADAATHPIALVVDHTGTGTSLLTGSPSRLIPHFGHGSAARHQEHLGATALSVLAPGLRQDVDTAADLAQALHLGLGPATLAVLQGGGPAQDS